MTGHWERETRKLNRHYQSGSGGELPEDYWAYGYLYYPLGGDQAAQFGTGDVFVWSDERQRYDNEFGHEYAGGTNVDMNQTAYALIHYMMRTQDKACYEIALNPRTPALETPLQPIFYGDSDNRSFHIPSIKIVNPRHSYLVERIVNPLTLSGQNKWIENPKYESNFALNIDYCHGQFLWHTRSDLATWSHLTHQSIYVCGWYCDEYNNPIRTSIVDDKWYGKYVLLDEHTDTGANRSRTDFYSLMLLRGITEVIYGKFASPNEDDDDLYFGVVMFEHRGDWYMQMFPSVYNSDMERIDVNGKVTLHRNGQEVNVQFCFYHPDPPTLTDTALSVPFGLCFAPANPYVQRLDEETNWKVTRLYRQRSIIGYNDQWQLHYVCPRMYEIPDIESIRLKKDPLDRKVLQTTENSGTIIQGGGVQ